jgi:hypothetical protein
MDGLRHECLQLEDKSMKRLILFASLCVVGFVLAPMASANAAVLVGTCKIHGSAEFKPGLLENGPKKIHYEFTSKAGGKLKIGGEGAGCVNQEGKTLLGKATVHSEGELACGAAVGELTGEGVGKGELSVEGGPYKFELRIVAAGGTVALAVTPEPLGSGVATGFANFLVSEAEPAAECVKKGVKKLEFDASVTGAI